jgi:hypothetical protein
MTRSGPYGLHLSMGRRVAQSPHCVGTGRDFHAIADDDSPYRDFTGLCRLLRKIKRALHMGGEGNFHRPALSLPLG